MKKLLLLLVITGALLPHADATVSAQGRCLSPAMVKEEFDRSDAVFAGSVRDISEEKVEGCNGECVRSKVTIRVARTWKGVCTKEVIIYLSKGSQSNNGRLLLELKKGDEWLIYAKGKPELYTGGCTRTKKLAEAEEDLQQLGSGQVIS